MTPFMTYQEIVEQHNAGGYCDTTVMAAGRDEIDALLEQAQPQTADYAAELDADAEAIRRAAAAGSCDAREIIDAQGDGWLCWCGRMNPAESVWCSHEEACD